MEAFKEAKASIDLHVASDGVEALAFLPQEGARPRCPAPGPDPARPQPAHGRTAARSSRRIKEDESLRLIPTVDPDDLGGRGGHPRRYQLHANAYVTKPVQLDAFERIVKVINDFWLTTRQAPRQRSRRMTDQAATRLLLVEDNPGDARLLRELFKEPGALAIAVTHVERMGDAEAHLADNPSI